jgi:hypothetical protein
MPSNSRKAFSLSTATNVLAESADFHPSLRTEGKKGPTKIMYIECKAGSLEGNARIGRVSFSKTGKTLYYKGKTFQSLKGAGAKSNYFDVETHEDYWISGPKKNGGDRLYGGAVPVEIDDDVRQEYWTLIRKQPERQNEKKA